MKYQFSSFSMAIDASIYVPMFVSFSALENRYFAKTSKRENSVFPSRMLSIRSTGQRAILSLVYTKHHFDIPSAWKHNKCISFLPLQAFSKKRRPTMIVSGNVLTPWRILAVLYLEKMKSIDVIVIFWRWFVAFIYFASVLFALEVWDIT